MTTTMRDEQASGIDTGRRRPGGRSSASHAVQIECAPVASGHPTSHTTRSPGARTGSLPAASRPPRAPATASCPADRRCERPDTGGHHLTSAIARAWWALDQRFRQRSPGTALHHRLLPKPRAAQALHAAKPELAATPGTSNHGWATALDLCGEVESVDTDEHRWLTGNGASLGWVKPSWAQRYGSKPEPWRWAFVHR